VSSLYKVFPTSLKAYIFKYRLKVLRKTAAKLDSTTGLPTLPKIESENTVFSKYGISLSQNTTL
jgi:hypothetical protein